MPRSMHPKDERSQSQCKYWPTALAADVGRFVVSHEFELASVLFVESFCTTSGGSRDRDMASVRIQGEVCNFVQLIIESKQDIVLFFC